MLQNQLTCRLVLIVIFGVIYIFAMLRMARCRSVETTTPQRHKVLRIVSIIALLLGVIFLTVGIFGITQVTYPEHAIDFTYSVNQVVRPSNNHVMWGYPTPEQNGVIMDITNAFSCLALATYCFFFKKSDRKWWLKIPRFIYGLLIYAFFCNATNFHYFDLAEMVAPFIFCLLAGRALTRSNQIANKQEDAAVQKMEDEKIKEEDKTEDATRFMPPKDVSDQNKPNEVSEMQSTEMTPAQTSATQTEQDKPEESSNSDKESIKYCRHCGKKVDYDSSAYCKYCGKEL